MAARLPNGDSNINFPIPHEPVGRFFPLKTPPPHANRFEIGLVLGGTVSAAAYTAGVLDFLIEALDAWTVAKHADDPAAPHHDVTIKIATGTSGGGISCVLFARTIGSAFPHCTERTPAEKRAQNPFYNTWVNQIDITDLLKTDDLAHGAPIVSLLCGRKLDEVSKALETYDGAPLGTNGTPAHRTYVETPLPVVLTLTNLRGIPYSAYFHGPSSRPEYYMDHADHMRFRVDLTGNSPPAALHPFEVGISATEAPGVSPWHRVIHAARGTSSFPVGLPPQTISRDPQHYRYRYTVINGKAEWLRPAWPYMIPTGTTAATPYEFLCVDGGCFNNEPISYAREWLAGLEAQNDRSADGAHRAVVLVDPFADTPDLGLTGDGGILKTGAGTLSALLRGARYATADLDLFTSEDVFSRFLVNPVRDDARHGALAGGRAIATGSLGGFGGFLSQAFRAHDFFLGRRNCQQFLRASFMLGPRNSLFKQWTAAQRTAHQDESGNLPVIPLMPAVAGTVLQPLWPKNRFDPESIRDAIKCRLEKLSESSAASLTQGIHWPLGGLVDFVASRIGAAGTGQVLDVITNGLRSWDLL